MKCQHCNSALVDGVCPNAEAHDAERIGAAIATAVREANAGIAETISSAVTAATAPIAEALRALRPEPVEQPAGGTDAPPPTANGARGVDPGDHVYGVYDQLWRNPNLSDAENTRTMRANFELTRMAMDGMGRLRHQPRALTPSDGYMQAYRHFVFDGPQREPSKFGQRIMVNTAGDNEAPRLRAMDSAESGYGADLVGAQYETELWRAARASDPLLAMIREIPMRFPTDTIPVDGALPELRLLGESTTSGASAYTESDTPSSKATLTAKKFGINQLWSGEIDEDSIIRYADFLREQLNRAAAHGLASSLYNGHTTNAATGNINLDDADPADTKHYLAYNGIRAYWLVTATGQGKDMSGALDPKEIDRARGKLNGTTDDVDADFNNINWGANASDLVVVCDFDTYMNLLDLDVVATVDKYGPSATVITGELGRYRGMRVFSPAYASKTEADGKASDTEASNTKGQISVFNPNGWIRGSLRGLSLYFDRVQRTDQFLFELYMRKAFTRFGGNVSAGIYNISG